MAETAAPAKHNWSIAPEAEQTEGLARECEGSQGLSRQPSLSPVDPTVSARKRGSDELEPVRSEVPQQPSRGKTQRAYFRESIVARFKNHLHGADLEKKVVELTAVARDLSKAAAPPSPENTGLAAIYQLWLIAAQAEAADREKGLQVDDESSAPLQALTMPLAQPAAQPAQLEDSAHAARMPMERAAAQRERGLIAADLYALAARLEAAIEGASVAHTEDASILELKHALDGYTQLLGRDPTSANSVQALVNADEQLSTRLKAALSEGAKVLVRNDWKIIEVNGRSLLVWLNACMEPGSNYSLQETKEALASADSWRTSYDAAWKPEIPQQLSHLAMQITVAQLGVEERSIELEIIKSAKDGSDYIRMVRAPRPSISPLRRDAVLMRNSQRIHAYVALLWAHSTSRSSETCTRVRIG